MKKRTPTARKVVTAAPAKKSRRSDKEIARELASCAVFTLKVFGRQGGTGIDLKTMKPFCWQDKFFDALDAYGVELDRERFYTRLEKRSKRRGL